MNYPISSIQPATTVRKNIFEILEEVNNTNEAVIVTRNDKPAAVILSYESFDSLMETMDIMSDPKEYKELLKRRKDTDYEPFDPAEFEIDTQGYSYTNNFQNYVAADSSRKKTKKRTEKS